jgi:nucleoside-diphosphate-sugar epimerase
MEKLKVLVTGGAGYIGNVLIRHLLDEGYFVTCLDNFLYSNNLSIASLVSNKNFKFIYGDVRDEILMKKAISEQDIIIPLAALVGAPSCEDKKFDVESINHFSIEILNKIRSSNQIVIFPSTNSNYGNTDGNTLCTEDMEPSPISSYGVTKVAAEKSLKNSGKDFIILRLATVFGISPRMRTDLMVNDFVLKSYKEGAILLYEDDFKRNFIHISDVARAFIHAIKNRDNMRGEIYNVGLHEANISKLELVKKIKDKIKDLEIIKKEGKIDPDFRNYVVSHSKMENTGFSCKTSLENGIEELIEGYKIIFKKEQFRNI